MNSLTLTVVPATCTTRADRVEHTGRFYIARMKREYIDDPTPIYLEFATDATTAHNEAKAFIGAFNRAFPKNDYIGYSIFEAVVTRRGNVRALYV